MEKKKNPKGFTLTEVIVAIAILAILTAMITVLSNNYVRTRRTIELRQNISVQLDNIYQQFSSNPQNYYAGCDVETTTDIKSKTIYYTANYKEISTFETSYYIEITCSKESLLTIEKGVAYKLEMKIFNDHQEIFTDYVLTRQIYQYEE